jgi:peptidoglycan/LPS O-acetylase OafA/YrhL
VALRLECAIADHLGSPARPDAGAAPRPGGHIPALDGIRGLAVLMVLAFHIFQVEPVPRAMPLRLLYGATTFGQTGVDLFFVLSGFLITGILYDAKQSRRYFLNFYGRRALRIFPLYYGMAFVMLGLVPTILGFQPTGLTWLSLGTFSANLAMASGSAGGMLGHYWSLAIEEQFYLIWPVVVLLLDRKALMRVCLGSMGVAALLRGIIESRVISSFLLTPCRMDTLLVGALLALAARGPTGLVGWSRRAVMVALAALAIAFPLCFAMRGSGSAWLAVVKYPLIAVLYGAILVIAVSAPLKSWTSRLLTLGPLRSLGRYSYGIYVYHPPMIHVAGCIIGLASAAFPLPSVHPALSLLGRVALIAGGSFAVAWVSWHVFEGPFLSLKRYFEYWAGSPEAEARADLYKRSAGRNDRSFTLGPVDGMSPGTTVGELA